MSFGQSLSGLNAAAQNLDVIGNNIANSATVGFKAGTASFADIYSNSLIGMGVKVNAITQDFSSGTISSTGNQFDMAIDGGKGLFVVQGENGEQFYTRNGQFFTDKNNRIINAEGQQLMGYAPGGTNLVGMTVPQGNIAPQATSSIANRINLDAAAVPTVAPFDPADTNTYSNATPITVYDSLGEKHRLIQYYTKRPAVAGESVWEVNYTLDGQNPTSSTMTGLTFDAAGRLISTPPSGVVQFDGLGAAGSPAASLQMMINYDGSTQFAGGFTQNFTADGYATGEYASLSIAKDGTLVANYTNGAKSAIGTLVLADFNNLRGLRSAGGNAWMESAESGQPILGTPGKNGLATIMGQAVEESNVDISQALVNMIMAQRTYQANAQTIKTQDQMVQTLMTMR